MKQRITIEQLNELSEEQKERLRDWWKPEPCDVYSYQNKTRDVVATSYRSDHGIQILHLTIGTGVYSDPWRDIHYKARCLPLLSIGQMIELLADMSNSNMSLTLYDVYGDIETYKINELCDSLWDEVKLVLKRTP